VSLVSTDELVVGVDVGVDVVVDVVVEVVVEGEVVLGEEVSVVVAPSSCTSVSVEYTEASSASALFLALG